jgi:hypothetical protein
MWATSLLNATISVSTCTYSGEGLFRQRRPAGLLLSRRRSPPVDERRRKLHKLVDIGKIGRQTNRNAQRTLFLMINDMQKLLKGHALFLSEAVGEVLTHKAEGDFTDPWIAETATPHRNPTQIGLPLHGIAIQDCAMRITEIEGNPSSTPVGGGWKRARERYLVSRLSYLAYLFRKLACSAHLSELS